MRNVRPVAGPRRRRISHERRDRVDRSLQFQESGVRALEICRQPFRPVRASCFPGSVMENFCHAHIPSRGEVIVDAFLNELRGRLFRIAAGDSIPDPVLERHVLLDRLHPGGEEGRKEDL